jgi:hypothetical protein
MTPLTEHRNHLRRAIDNMEKTDTCLAIFDRAIQQGAADVEAREREIAKQGRKRGIKEAADLVGVLELGDPSGLSRREQLRILDVLATAEKMLRKLAQREGKP